MGRPRASWLQQVDRHLKEMGMGQASAWGMARGPWSTGRKWTQRHAALAHAPIPDLAFSFVLWVIMLKGESQTQFQLSCRGQQVFP